MQGSTPDHMLTSALGKFLIALTARFRSQMDQNIIRPLNGRKLLLSLCSGCLFPRRRHVNYQPTPLLLF